MRTIRTVVFSKEETRILHAASRFTDIVFPLSSDPLVQRSPEALARAVDETDQRRRALTSLLSPYDLIQYPRLRAAQIFLGLLLEQMAKESDVNHWLGISATPDHPQSRQMAEVLAAERARQQLLVKAAIEIVDRALLGLGPADDPRPEERRSDYGGFSASTG